MSDGLYYCRDLSWPSLLYRNLAQAALEEMRVLAAVKRMGSKYRHELSAARMHVPIGGRR